MFLKTAASLLLIFNGTGAIYGGWNLITHPDGSSLQMPLDLLKYSPFNDFLIPGIILFVTSGTLSFVALAMLAFSKKNYPLYVIGEGAILFGWIIIEVIMLRAIASLHYIFGTIGIGLFVIGFFLKQIEQQSNGKQQFIPRNA